MEGSNHRENLEKYFLFFLFLGKIIKKVDVVERLEKSEGLIRVNKLF